MIIPHPIPYQGSKRKLASAILGIACHRRIDRLFEPFAGSAAITLAAASGSLADRYVLADSLAPLMDIWRAILTSPQQLADRYAEIWVGQETQNNGYYNEIRDRYNSRPAAAELLYLLARCVKNSPRWNRSGHFNQSHDKRRLGMKPTKMRAQIFGAHQLLADRTDIKATDFQASVATATEHDLVYMDPPYQGTSGTRDSRYHQGLEPERLVSALADLNRRNVPWLLSYDGRCGEKTYGPPLPQELGATHLAIEAGRSSQATLNGHNTTTIESLYVSPNFGPVRLSTPVFAKSPTPLPWIHPS